MSLFLCLIMSSTEKCDLYNFCLFTHQVLSHHACIRLSHQPTVHRNRSWTIYPRKQPEVSMVLSAINKGWSPTAAVPMFLSRTPMNKMASTIITPTNFTRQVGSEPGFEQGPVSARHHSPSGHGPTPGSIGVPLEHRLPWTRAGFL